MDSQSANTSAVFSVNSLDFDDRVLHAEGPVLVDVSAQWCAPCRAAEPVLERLALEHAGQLDVVQVDGGEAPDVAASLGVRGFPTFLLFVRGEEVARLAGFPGEKRFRTWLAQHTC